MSAAAMSAIQALSGQNSFNATGMQSPMQMPATMQGPISGLVTGLDPLATSTETMPFADLMTDAVGEVNKLQDTAKSAVQGLMSGTGVDVHEAMIASEKASMAFELTLAIRNKAVAAYQSVMSMQF